LNLLKNTIRIEAFSISFFVLNSFMEHAHPFGRVPMGKSKAIVLPEEWIAFGIYTLL
jgi:hypothetical protein